MAANAVDAGKAYENIVKAIDAAHDAARTALNAAESAKMKVYKISIDFTALLMMCLRASEKVLFFFSFFFFFFFSNKNY